MEDDDYNFDYDNLPDLPPEAGEETEQGFEPNDDWLATANREMQHVAMRSWFLSRFIDPAIDTPYNSAEGGYLYINGGPYNAEDELYSRFGDVIEDSDAIIGDVIDDVESEGTTEWAPAHTDREDEYDDRFDIAVVTSSEPLRRLMQRLEDQQEILTLTGTKPVEILAKNLIFSATIGALEAFLYEVLIFWINSSDTALRAIVTNYPKYKEQKISLSEIFKKTDGLKAQVKGDLQATVWHRWKNVDEIYQSSLGIKLPDYKSLEAPLLKRHDIVHRSGLNKEGSTVTVTDEDIKSLIDDVSAFATEIDNRIKKSPFYIESETPQISTKIERIKP